MTTIEKTDLPHNPSIERRAETFFVAIVGGTNCKIGGRGAKMGLVSHP